MNLTTKKIQDQASGVPFFFKVELVEDPADIEDSELNISVTDGARSWSRKGQRKHEQPERWITHVHKALTDPTAEEYEFELTICDADLKVTIRWRQPGMAGRVKADILLPLCEGPKEMQTLLDTLFGTLADLQASHEQHKKSIADLTEEAKRSQALVEEYVKQKETREEELYIKFAAVLNEKKAKIRELKQQAEDLQRRIKDADADADSDQGSRGRGGDGDVSDDEGIYSAATEGSEEEQPMTLLPVQDTIGQQTQRPLRQAMQDTHGSRMQRPVPRQEQARRQQQQQPAMQPQLSELQEESSLPVDMDSQPVHEEQNMRERAALLDAPTQPAAVPEDTDMHDAAAAEQGEPPPKAERAAEVPKEAAAKHSASIARRRRR